MAKTKTKVKTSDNTQRYRPALTVEARENQMISLAIDLAEQQLRDGTASSQIVTHYLKLGSTKERIEKEILEKQKELIEAKTDSIKSAKDIKKLYKDALKAMSEYKVSGNDESEYEYEDEDY